MDNSHVDHCELFWVDQPNVLFKTLHIFPTEDMTDAQRLNTITRVVIIISLIMYLIKFPLWWLFLFLSLFTIITIWSFNKQRYRCNSFPRNPIITHIKFNNSPDVEGINIISIPE